MRFKLLASTATSFSVISLYFDWLLVANLPNVSEKIKAASREKDKKKKKKTLATHRSLIFLHSILLRAWVVVMKINALHFNTFATIPSFFDLCASGPV